MNMLYSRGNDFSSLYSLRWTYSHTLFPFYLSLPCFCVFQDMKTKVRVDRVSSSEQKGGLGMNISHDIKNMLKPFMYILKLNWPLHTHFLDHVSFFCETLTGGCMRLERIIFFRLGLCTLKTCGGRSSRLVCHSLLTACFLEVFSLVQSEKDVSFPSWWPLVCGAGCLAGENCPHWVRPVAGRGVCWAKSIKPATGAL